MNKNFIDDINFAATYYTAEQNQVHQKQTQKLQPAIFVSISLHN